MSKRDLIAGVLESMGYNPQIDGDGDLMFRKEMKAMYVLVGDEDDPYVTILLPQFADVEENDIALTLTACNKLTREIKLAKLYLDRSMKTVSAKCEFYYSDEEALKLNLSHAISILAVVRSFFRDTEAELKEQ